MQDIKNTWYSDDAEKTVLGAMLQDSAAVSLAAKTLTEESFQNQSHRELFNAMNALAAKRTPVDLVTVDEELRRRGTLDAIGGVQHLVLLTQYVPTTANVRAYIQIVVEKHERRRLFMAGETIRKMAQDEDMDTAGIVSEARNLLRDIATSKAEWVPMMNVLMNTYDAVERRAKGEDKPISVGIPSLDKVFYGFVPGEFTVIGARPGVGKSAIGGAIAMQAAMTGKKVGIVSLEMVDIQYGQRILAYTSGIDSEKIRNADLDDDSLFRIVESMGAASNLPIEFMFTGRKIEHISSAIQQSVDREGLDLVIIDYLQLIETMTRFKSNYERVTHISRMLKEMSTMLKLPIVALAQLSRESEKRGDKTPIMSDLRDSGSIEQDADNILLLHRPESKDERGVYPEDKEYLENYAQMGYQYLHLEIAKQRQGKVGHVNLLYEPRVMRYKAIERGRNG